MTEEKEAAGNRSEKNVTSSFQQGSGRPSRVVYWNRSPKKSFMVHSSIIFAIRYFGGVEYFVNFEVLYSAVLTTALHLPLLLFQPAPIGHGTEGQ